MPSTVHPQQLQADYILSRSCRSCVVTWINVGPYASFQLSIYQSTLPEMSGHLAPRNGLACPVQNATWLWTHVLKSWTVLDEDGTQSHPLLPYSFQCPVAEKWQEIQQEVRLESLVFRSWRCCIWCIRYGGAATCQHVL